ncbi:MAG: hypothetical protein R3B59_00075 [Dehalococcoidia bacterium]
MRRRTARGFSMPARARAAQALRPLDPLATRGAVWSAALPLLVSLLLVALACSSSASPDRQPGFSARLTSDNAAVAGLAVLESSAGGYYIRVSLSGLPEGVYAVHLVQGACESLSDEATVIGPLFTDGASEARLDAPVRAELALGVGWSVDIRTRVSDGSTAGSVACGELSPGGS